MSKASMHAADNDLPQAKIKYIRFLGFPIAPSDILVEQPYFWVLLLDRCPFRPLSYQRNLDYAKSRAVTLSTVTLG